MDIRKFFAPDFSLKKTYTSRQEEEEFLALFSEACKKRMQADVPAGTFLSGGLDSLAVTAMLLASGFKDLDVATIGFTDATYNELPAAEFSAEQMRSAGLDSFDHRKRIVRGDDFAMLKMLWQEIGEPFGDASLLPSGVLCSFMAERRKFALSGDGADELFAGYERYRAMSIIRKLTGNPGGVSGFFIRNLARIGAMILPGGVERSKAERLKRFLKSLSYGATPEAYAFICGKASPSLLRQTAAPPLLEAMRKRQQVNTTLAGKFAAIAGKLSASDWHEYWSETDIGTYLPGDILPKVDTASMSFSLEVRSPFLDLELAKFAAALPWEYKLEGKLRKAIITRAMGKTMPFMTTPRIKRGFGVPLTDFLSGCWKEEGVRAMHSPLLAEYGLLTPAGADILLKRTDKETMDLKWSFIVLANFLESR